VSGQEKNVMAQNELGTHFVKTFESNAIHLVQQKFSKQRRTVTEKNPGPSEKHSFRVVDARGAMVDRANLGANAGKRPATNYADTVFNDRMAFSTPKNTADSFSKPDMRRMLEDPQSEIYRAMLPQVGRTYDDVINTAIHAVAVDTLANNYAFGAGAANHTVGGAAVAFDPFNHVNTLLRYFNAEEVDPDEEKFITVTPFAVEKILAEAKATSADYVNAGALLAGKVQRGWMGFTWIMTTRCTSPAGLERYYAAYTRDAVGLLILGDVALDYGKDASKQFDTTIQLDIDIGAVRIQDKKCKRIHVLETA
jgi:capsid protein